MPTPGTYPSTTAISFSQVNTEFVLTTPSPMDNKYRFEPTAYSSNPVSAAAIPTTPAGIFPVNILHGRTYIAPFVNSYTTPNPTTPYTTTWTATFTGNIKVLVVGGGGGGGSGNAGGSSANGGGGGGGVIYNASFPVVSGTPYAITVGGGGAVNTQGGPSAFATVTAGGGGRGGQSQVPTDQPTMPGLAPGGSGIF